MGAPRTLAALERAYAILLRAFPHPFRAEFGSEMRTAFRETVRTEFEDRGAWGLAGFAIREALITLQLATRERLGEQHGLPYRVDGPNVAPASIKNGSGVMLLGSYQDIRTTFRKLYRSAAFAAMTITTLTLGLAVNVVLFSMLHAVRDPQLPYAQPERLLVIHEAFPRYGWTQQLTSLPTFRDLQAHATSFEALAAYSQRRISLAVGDGQRRCQAAIISANLWSILGVTPTLGRGFTDVDDRPGAVPSVVIGDRIWRDLFGADRNVVGRTAVVDGVQRSIVGVMPPGLRFPEAEDVWLPLGSLPDAPLASPNARAGRAWQIVGRLKTEASVTAAREELRVIGARLADTFPESNGGWLLTAVPIAEESYEATGAFFGALQIGGLLLLLIMCTNLGNLLLARGEQRRRELAICASLGASRWRLVRLLLLEVFLLATIGVAAALLLASWAITLLPNAIPESIPFFIRFRIDATVVMFTVLVAIATAVIAGLGAAMRATKGDPYPTLAQGSAALVASPTSSRMRRTFLFVQTAMAAALLSSALSVGLGLMRFQGFELGFDPKRTLLVDVPLPLASYGDMTRPRTFSRLLIERLAASPNVEAVGLSAPIGLFNAPGTRNALELDGRTDTAATNGSPDTYRAVTPAYFRATGMRLLSGRAFADTDRAGAEDVVVVNAEAARRLFNEKPPEGRRIRFGRDAGGRRWRTVVGVVANTTEQPLDPEIEPRIYVPFDQDPGRSITVTIRTTTAPETFTRHVLDIVHAIDPALATETPMTAERRLSVALWPMKFFASFAAGFSLFALIVACGGVYGLSRYLTLARTREIALRLALGAGLRNVMFMMARQNGSVIFSGLFMGLLGSIAISNVLQHVLIGIPSFDPLAIGIAAVTLTAAAGLAVGMPALHARKVDPAVALRID